MEHIPFLDETVRDALRFLAAKRAELPQLPAFSEEVPLVVGSGNALVVGQVLFHNRPAFFATESDFRVRLFPQVKTVVLVSASGEKDAPHIAEAAKAVGKWVVLLTTNADATARRFADESLLFPAQPEPYSYNVSTYLGMLLAHTGESPDVILQHLSTLTLTPDALKAPRYVLVLPNRFAPLMRLFRIKFSELFGRRVAHEVETESSIRHGMTIVPSEDERFIRFLESDAPTDIPREWQASEEQVTPVYLSPQTQEGAMMALGYFVLGLLQRAHPPYFKTNLPAYLSRLSWGGETS